MVSLFVTKYYVHCKILTENIYSIHSTHDTAFSDVIFINQMRKFPGFLLSTSIQLFWTVILKHQ